MRWPLTHVPFVLRRSSTYHARPRKVSAACVPLAKSPLNAKRKIDHRKHPAPAFSAPKSARKYDEPRRPADVGARDFTIETELFF